MGFVQVVNSNKPVRQVDVQAAGALRRKMNTSK